MKNRIPLNVSSVPPVNLDEVVWYWDENTLMDSTFSFIYTVNIFPQLSYTNVSSYLRRLNFDYKIEFLADPADGAKVTITTASGSVTCIFLQNYKYVDWQGSEFKCNDYGALNSSPIDYSVMEQVILFGTPGEEIFLIKDSLRIAGAWVEAYNYNLSLGLLFNNDFKSRKALTILSNIALVTQYSTKDPLGMPQVFQNLVLSLNQFS